MCVVYASCAFTNCGCTTNHLHMALKNMSQQHWGLRGFGFKNAVMGKALPQFSWELPLSWEFPGSVDALVGQVLQG